jgi:hypothetical protein
MNKKQLTQDQRIYLERLKTRIDVMMKLGHVDIKVPLHMPRNSPWPPKDNWSLDSLGELTQKILKEGNYNTTGETYVLNTIHIIWDIDLIPNN